MIKKSSLVKGFCFGLTSGIITTLGMIIGLYSGTHSKLVVIGGILSIAVADSFSDALGIHISEESDNKKTHIQVWLTTAATFFSKLIFSITFIIPVILFDLLTAIFISVFWGIMLLGVLSYYIAKENKDRPLPTISEHLTIAFVVIVMTYIVGKYVRLFFS